LHSKVVFFPYYDNYTLKPLDLIITRLFYARSIIMLENIDAATLIPIASFIVVIAMQLVGFGRIIGSVNVKLTSHQEQHIRHQARLDEHSKMLGDHERDLAVLIDRRERRNS
jgi:hypothetical protein